MYAAIPPTNGRTKPISPNHSNSKNALVPRIAGVRGQAATLRVPRILVSEV